MRRRDEPTDWREGRRLRAWELKQQGWSQKAIADALGVTEGAVSQWMKRAQQGSEALKRRPPPGATPRLTEEQRAQLPDLLAKGPQHYGFVGAIWTQSRVRAVIERVFGVRYHRDHINRLLKAIGWSLQKPIERAIERDDEAIEQWKAEQWPAIKKKLKARDEQSST
jgi:transposase